MLLFWISSAGILVYPIASGGVKKDRFKHKEWKGCSHMNWRVVSNKGYRNPLILKLVLTFLVKLALVLIYARMGLFVWKSRRMDVDRNKKSVADRRGSNIKSRALKLMLAILITYFICWLPYDIVTLLRLFPIPSNSLQVDPIFMLTAYSLAMLNSSINPAVYALASRNFRVAYRNILGRAQVCLIRKDKTHSLQSRSLSSHILSDLP